MSEITQWLDAIAEGDPKCFHWSIRAAIKTNDEPHNPRAGSIVIRETA
jgi:hypothetical protein